MDGRLALAYADGLDEDVVVAGGLAEHYGLAGLAGHAAERTGGG